MPLLFEDAGGSGKRKWQCFVCGQHLEDYEKYKSHVLEKHEEGREYLSCPDCAAPVRDLKLHYKAKHPSRIMPTALQTRVVVWHDFKPGGKDGQKKTRRPNTRKGTFVSRKSGTEFEYRSGFECEFLECIESDMDVENFAYEPIKIPYFWRGEWHNYIPDLRINFIDSSTQIWEIKPANQTNYEQNKAKWAAAHNFCTNVGWEFVVLTEVGLGKLKTKVKRQQPLNEG